MEWLIRAPTRRPPAARSPNAFLQLLPTGADLRGVYFLLNPPQAKRAKEHKAMVAALAVGDEGGHQRGILGKVTETASSS